MGEYTKTNGTTRLNPGARLLRVKMEESHVSERSLAKEMGVSEGSVGNWRRGSARPGRLYRAFLQSRFAIMASLWDMDGDVPPAGEVEAGRWVQQYIDTKSVTQTAFAESIKVSGGSLSRWVRGLATPPLLARKAIERETGLPAEAWRIAPESAPPVDAQPQAVAEDLVRLREEIQALRATTSLVLDALTPLVEVRDAVVFLKRELTGTGPEPQAATWSPR